MIGIDTNVIVRLLLRDDEAMFQRAAALIGRTSPDDPLLVNVVVVAESLWVLERKAGVDRAIAPRMSSSSAGIRDASFWSKRLTTLPARRTSSDCASVRTLFGLGSRGPGRRRGR